MMNSTNYRNFKCCPQCVDPLLNCSDQPNAHRVPKNELSDSEAGSTVKNFALRIKVARKNLGKDLEDNGDQILSRWKKWPKVKREAMLRQVEPEMEDTSYRHTKEPLWGQGATFRISKLPYLDIETLRDNPMRLLSLIHYRSTYTPGEWVPYDMSRMLGIWRSLDGNRQWLAVIGSGLKLPGSVECWSEFANPFACPPAFDAQRCCEQLEADLAEAEDHLALLQTSSEYLHTYLRGHGTLDPLIRPLHKVISLQMVKKQCEMVRDASRIKMQNITLGSGAVPRPSDRAMSGLFNETYALCRQAKRDLFTIIKDSTEFGFDHPLELRPWLDEDKLRGFLYQLPLCRPYGTSTEEAGIFNGIDEHLARADSRERSRIDRGILQQLSFAATLQLIQTNIALSNHHVISSGVVAVCHPEFDCPPEIVINGKSTALEKFQKHCWPKGQRNEEWLAKADEDRRLMLELWNRARQEYSNILSAARWPADLVDRVMSSVAADHSPQYRAELEAERSEVQEKIAVAKRQNTITKTYAPVQTMWGPDTRESKTAVALGRTKPKTRPAEPVLQDISNEQTVRRGTNAIETPVGGLQDRIPVNTNSLRVLAILFGVGNSKATVKWQEIVTALTDAGMVAMNSGGSAVTFKMLSKSDSGSPRIVFHKPHPDPAVDSITQLWMGKRLNKWFGWDAGTFVKRQKSSACL
ncbi:unnamed protein product [Zymoseptoria tritici ST99CH_1E4]|uniref:Uncharacterized protein n=1 Tax=Zymoseptoria tritici ST99CH_1E4 TaxID=1276532 RepID=A0A2H1H921_ZYMTR|nr:unnamed protein product [Zymoseptoria tritici ST99CH_1E4]